MSKPLNIGAFAAVQYLPHIETFLATGDGDFDGPIWAKATSEIKFVDGRASFTMVHEFMSRDGSRISTVDTATGIQVPGIDEVSLTVMHKVVDSTGKFEGLRGTFPSFGLHNFATGKGVQRFGGELS
tara:strand:- start:299 stop:679 length:381 start_codon:yes stop_codon:yes gene_type:complete